MRRMTRSGNNNAVSMGEPSNPSRFTPPVLDEARIRNMIQQVLAESQGKSISERVETPVVVPTTREERERPVPPIVPCCLEPIYGLPSQHQPSVFRGTMDPIVAEEWIRSVERTTTLFPMTEWEKIRYANFLFRGDARIWWELMEDTHDIASMTWGDFRRLFETEYGMVDRVHEKTQEFINLQQGTSSVKEYSIRFNSLARFAPGIVSTPELRVNNFVYGLNPKIARDVMVGAQPPQTYSEALERALRAEIFVNKLIPTTLSASAPSVPPLTPQRGRADVSNNREAKNKKRFQPKKNRRDWQNKRPRTIDFSPCQKCGRYHPGECLKELGRNVCYKCQQPGHVMRDCKAPPAPTAQTSRGTNARVFTVAQSETEVSPSAVTGSSCRR
ncbi:uncharacterized protein LOC116136343 isoform X2 [Pistacia vera]|nr:uncharacterized protein LOC116136343 isoform X2 [Pistacia vera]XP_031277912.1 uncharacterized protein LOC116136343 isoform X2 [Pistacia vera]